MEKEKLDLKLFDEMALPTW
ncbi:hypothetical protein CCACVL1_03920 [Corchorus capsularis]|uniref:Uncharacterized protein n=1 Tax=Corchorus capsularis TaxID=210143 RepID=A0A1R3JWF7_COCAP|nr:hypothetical protein CCACVL1_03920 [Corchorus capsularis]